jgi:hypothetical protein
MEQRGNKSRARRGSKIPRRVQATLGDGPAYSGQQRATLRLTGESTILSTTVTTGVIAQSLAIDKTAIGDFATRFASTFDEYRVLKASIKIRPLAVSTGVTRFFFDEKTSSTPSATQAAERVGQTLANNSAAHASTRSMSWRARDLGDLAYQSIGGSTATVWLKVYTDTANFGAPIAVTPLWLIEYNITFEFRGLKTP